MSADPQARIAQLQLELDEAQRIANNNYRLYTQAKEQRDVILRMLKSVSLALPVLRAMCRVAGLHAGEATAQEQIDLVQEFIKEVEK